MIHGCGHHTRGIYIYKMNAYNGMYIDFNMH